MAVQGVNAFKTTDGKVFLTEREALVAEHDYNLHEVANALADRIRPAYSDLDEIAANLLGEPALVIRLAELMSLRP